MSSQPTIFDSPFKAESNTAPFSFAGEEVAAQSPFGLPSAAQSPFSAVAEEPQVQASFPEAGKPAKLPPPRHQTDRMARLFPDNTTPFGYDALTTALPQPLPSPSASPFGIVPLPFPGHAQPIAGHFAASPFTVHSEPKPAPLSALPSASPFSVVPPLATEPQALAQIPQSFRPANPPFAQAPAPQLEPVPLAPTQQPAMVQLELRAIFGLDRDLSAEEIVQRCRSLPGVRNIARITNDDISAFDYLKHNLGKFGFEPGSLRLCVGNSPIEFITAEHTTFAVHTDGSFAPGVRETLILAARQLSRMS